MKKFSLALTCVIISLGSATAQNYDEPKHEISLAYGLPVNTSNFVETLADGFTGGLSNRQMDKDRYIGPISLEYYYHVSPLVGVGAIGIFSTHKGLDKSTPVQEHKSSYFTIMPAVKFNWLRRDSWGLYSKAALGFTHASYKIADEGTGANEIKSSDNLLNFQVSLIGVEAGNRSIRGFAELGFGEQGLALAGIRFRF